MAGVDTGVDSFQFSAMCGLRITRKGLPKTRLHPVFPGLCGASRFGIHNNNLGNGCRALVERVFLREVGGELRPPPPCVADVESTLKGFRAGVLAHLGVHRRRTVQQFVDSYNGRRQGVYARAALSLETTPVHRGDFRIDNAFVKAEKINFTSKGDPAPRVIQPRNPRYNVEVGRYLKFLEHPVYEAIGEVMGSPTVMKGYNAAQTAGVLRSKWDRFSKPVAIGLDASRFDQHVRPTMLEWEHSVYIACFRGAEAEHLAWLLKGQVNNVCTLRACDGVIKYRVHGSRMSGDMNTALGNCLIMCALLWRLRTELGFHIEFVNNGDDCVAIMEEGHTSAFRKRVSAFFLDYGFTMKVEEPAFQFEQIEFCQAHPVFCDGTWLMVRNVHTILSKDGVCVVKDYATGAMARAWLGAVGECGLAMYGGVPVLQEFYLAFQRHGTVDREVAVVAETGMAHLARGMHREVAVVGDEARVSFWRAFDVSPTQQRELEEHLCGVSVLTPSTPCIRGIPPRGTIPF